MEAARSVVVVLMLWQSCWRPFFRPGNVSPAHQRPTGAIGQCPCALLDKLKANGLLPDEKTDRQGNCGLDAFARSFMAQTGNGQANVGPSASARNRRELRKNANKLALLRRVGVAWLEANSLETIWPGMTVAKLCCTVSNRSSFQEYLATMRQDREWVDTAFLHALGRAYGVNVMIIQAHVEEALVGADLTEVPGHATPIMVPVALVNDHHFWGLIPCQEDIAVGPVDKGEHASLQARLGKGLCPNPSGKGLCPSPSDHDRDAALGPIGKGTRPRPDGDDLEDGGLDDGEPPEAAFPPAEVHSRAEAVEAELEMCQALSTWQPWSAPSMALLQAMAKTQRVRGAAHAAADIVTTCERRAEAITELAYEEAHSEQMPEAFRYQRLARIRLQGCPDWKRVRGDKSRTHRYMTVCSGIRSVEALSIAINDGDCSRHGRAHGPGNEHCQGMAGLTATMVYNWRVLWWSLPQIPRKEHLLHMFVNSLRAHRASGGADERWRMQYTFLGQNVCRDAFLLLTGLGASTLQAARDQALAGKVSWSSPAERGLHGGRIENTNKAHSYLNARSWLEWYAATHAELSPMDGRAYLPAGRKCFYYAHYRKGVLEKHGVTEDDAADARAYALASRRSKKRKTNGAQASNTADAEAYASAAPRMALAAQRMADVPLAESNTFMAAWRIECPWLIVCKSVSMFTRCSVCEYLRLLIDQTPRDQEPLRRALQARLGDHYEFQAAQRLAHGRLEELCANSGGAKWFMLIDKMDQSKTVCPAIWSQLATKMFQDQEKRLITGLIGSMWFGTRLNAHHVRTVFNDCGHGSEMQCSAILQNLHEVAMGEGHLPEEFNVGADNTPKETKNKYTFWFFMWLLCVLDDTPLTVICVVFLLVGHTHNKLDRLFSRIAVALKGKDYFTVEGLLRQVKETLKYTALSSSHLGQVWAWKGLIEGDLPGSKYEMHNLRSAHAFRFSRDRGIYMQWKQWSTDEAWSTPIQMVSASEVAALKRWRPAAQPMEFPEAGRKLDWLGRLEAWCAAQPAGSNYLGLHREFTWLRAAVNHGLPGTYAPGTEVDDILRDLRALPHARPEERAAGSQHHQFPHDFVAQMYPGADVPRLPHDALVRIEGLTHNCAGAAIRSTVLAPGSHIVIAAPGGTTAHGQALPIVVGQVVDTSCKKGSLVVAWYLPELARVENFRGGRKKMVIDVFGPWTPVDAMVAQTLGKCRLPDPIVPVQSVLEANFDLTESQTLPYDVFDALRARHSIDLTGFNLSMTRHGNIYRSYVLMRGGV